MRILIPSVLFILLLFSTSQAQFEGGSGMGSDPYQVATVEQLQEIRNHLDAHFIQIADIDASVTENWNSGDGFHPLMHIDESSGTMIQFTGSYEGNGHKISYLFIDRSDEKYVGLFGIADSTSSVKNVILEDVTISGSYYVGGLIGHNLGIAYGSTISGLVSGIDHVGGLIGKNSGRVQGAGFNGTVSANVYSGGLVGANYGGAISDSYSSGDVTGSEGMMGGLIGNNNGDIINSYSEVEVSGRRYVGGLIGWHHAGEVSGSYATGDVLSESGFSGGLVGLNYGVIIKSYALGNVSENRDNAGGLAGWNSDESLIQDSYASGNVSARNRSGGLIGVNEGIIRSSYASGNVAGKSEVGGLVGMNTENGEIRHSHASGIVAGESEVGGLAGMNIENGEIRYSYSVGTVTGNEYIGGLVGANMGMGYIYKSFSAGLATGVDAVGGLIGINASVVSMSYWDKESSENVLGVGKLTSLGVSGLTTTEMTGVAAYEFMSTFDFDEMWLLTEGYPALYWEDVSSLPIPTSVDGVSTYPAAFILSQNYPNPFNPSTQIRFALPEQAHVQSTVYNLLGQKVAGLLNEIRSPGWHEVSFDASHLSSGLYLYRLQTEQFIENKQMLLTR